MTPTIVSMPRPQPDFRRFVLVATAVGSALALATVAVGALESVLSIPDASAAFLLAVVAIAVAFGTTPAVLTAVGAFIVYDFLFTEPRFTLTVHNPAEWLTLLLLLVVGGLVGRLAGRQRDRAEDAMAREREARALFNISFSLATRRTSKEALASIVEMLREETRMSRVWLVVGEVVAADTEPSATPPAPRAVHTVLRRRPGDEPAEWVRVRSPSPGRKADRELTETPYRVLMTVDDRAYGSLWGSRSMRMGDPDAGETRVLAAAADQIAGALERDRLQGDATSAEVSRRSEALKSALLDSVSHDLRTPLAAIRAAAGTLMDPAVDWPDEQRRAIASSIDREADWLNRLVTNLLDMSRIEAGELKPSIGAFDALDLIDQAVRRFAMTKPVQSITVDAPVDLPPVQADEVFLGQVLANTLDNAAKYAGPADPIQVSARAHGDTVRVTVEDGGPGVPPEALPRLFEKFYRVPRRGEGSRRGTGIGLSVVQGLVQAMGGQVTARPSRLGGLAIDLDLPIDRNGLQG
jgi:two-component system, OmpR family, sensor histidine kinase KdpD